MERTLRNLLKEKDIIKINDYLASEFYNDCEAGFNNREVIEYLEEEFYDIDCMIYDGEDVRDKIYDTLNKAIEMLKDAK